MLVLYHSNILKGFFVAFAMKVEKFTARYNKTNATHLPIIIFYKIS